MRYALAPTNACAARYSTGVVFARAPSFGSHSTHSPLRWHRRKVHLNSGPAVQSLSKFWTPTISKSNVSKNPSGIDAQSVLVYAGFLRQTYAGIFHLLPLGLRVQDKIEALIDRHMKDIGASKTSLSSITSEALWERSGRLTGKDSELFHLEDRKDAKLLLSPTHEEEITSLVANVIHSYRELPLRLYQVSRKYRDERRPRSGLLRGREFVMKDLYTFDLTPEDALTTYSEVRSAYDKIFKDLGVPCMTATADSGSMGGDLSHEYHISSWSGEDVVIKCSNCGHTINQEIALLDCTDAQRDDCSLDDITVEELVSKDHKTFVQIHFPTWGREGTGQCRLNLHAVRLALPDVEILSGVDQDSPLELWIEAKGNRRIILYDPRLEQDDDPLRSDYVVSLLDQEFPYPSDLVPPEKVPKDVQVETREGRVDGKPILLSLLGRGERCPKCKDGFCSTHRAIEVGHTFHLGDRYSKPFKLQVRNKDNTLVNVEMGCHGIGVSRLIAAVATVGVDASGLNWPVSIAPFCITVVPAKGYLEQAEQVSSVISKWLQTSRDELDPLRQVDIALDDRDETFGWKLNDADLIGYPVIIVVGRAYAETETVEIQCRQLKVKENIVLDELGGLKKIRQCLHGVTERWQARGLDMY